MPRIHPITLEDADFTTRAAFAKHVTDYAGSRITNMKATLGHSLVAFNAYMQWYPLYDEVKKIIGNRLAYLYAHAISLGSNCPLCTTFFRKIIIDNGEKPEDLILTDAEQLLLDVGSEIAVHQGAIPEDLFARLASAYRPHEIVVLVAFAGQMVATNIFNNALEVTIDGYLTQYLTLTKGALSHQTA